MTQEGQSPFGNFYVGGTVSNGTQTFEIVESTQFRVAVAEALTIAERQSFLGAITVTDDDMLFLPADFEPLFPRNNLINDRIIQKFIPAYILVHEAASPSENPRNAIPFKLNESVGVTSSLDDFQDLEDSEGFWSHLVIAAYQGAYYDDGDPNEELGGTSPLLGATVNGYGPLYIQHFCYSAIYLEAIREFFRPKLKDPCPSHVLPATVP